MRAEDAQGPPNQSHVSPSILVYEDKTEFLSERVPMCHLSFVSEPLRSFASPEEQATGVPRSYETATT